MAKNEVIVKTSNDQTLVFLLSDMVTLEEGLEGQMLTTPAGERVWINTDQIIYAKIADPYG